MSKYPGTQFRVHDNSQATAIVPITKTNANDAVQYLSAFASIKGPEGITFTSGEDFYTRFGTQDNINFKKYGQPLLQASMNINNGAALLASLKYWLFSIFTRCLRERHIERLCAIIVAVATLAKLSLNCSFCNSYD